MIIARAPFRISFVGGGTDFPDYYKAAGYGNVIVTTINKYIYVTVIKKFDGRVSLKYSQYECVDHINGLKHDIVREGLRMFDVETGVEIDIISDIPAFGSGLGSSSALSAALLMALAKFKGQTLIGKKLAEKICELEIDILKKPIGKQDQYATCIGGFQKIIFWSSGIVENNNLSEPIWDFEDKTTWLKQAAILFYVDGDRRAGDILQTHKSQIPLKKEIFDMQRDMVNRFLLWLHGKNSYEQIGDLINRNWQIKKTITPTATTERIDRVIEKALNAGAYGAKICGAGGGGFMLVICEPEKQNMVREALSELPEVIFNFENEGAKILYAD